MSPLLFPSLRTSLASIPPSNKQQPLKKTEIGSTNHEKVKLTKQYNSRVFFFLPSCVGAAVFNLAKNPSKSFTTQQDFERCCECSYV